MKDVCGRTLRLVMTEAHFVGVDAHIDPKSAETDAWLPCRGAVSEAD